MSQLSHCNEMKPSPVYTQLQKKIVDIFANCNNYQHEHQASENAVQSTEKALSD